MDGFFVFFENFFQFGVNYKKIVINFVAENRKRLKYSRIFCHKPLNQKNNDS
jgi:hypothetical protein